MREKRWCRETSSNSSLRSTEIGWSSSNGPRFKVGVLGKGYAWMLETLSFAKVSSGRFGKSKASGLGSVRELPRVITHASRGRVFSYSSYFMLKGHSLAIGFSPNRRASSKAV